MDIGDQPDLAYRRVADSLATTQAELVQANLLFNEYDGAETSRRRAIGSQLARMAQAIETREQGRPGLFLPENPKDVEVVVSGLRSFAEKIEGKLAGQATVLRKGRRAWAVASAVLAALSAVPAAVVVALAIAQVTDLTPALVTATALVGAGLVAAAVACFRIYQTQDESERRILEKSLALTFLEAAIELTDAKPQAASVLERSFEMFLAHYEAPHAPLVASDLAVHS